MSVPTGWAGWRDGLERRLAADPLADPAVRRRAALVLVDDLAATVLGGRHAEVAAFAGLQVRGGSGESRVLAGGTAPRERAAAANAVAAGWDELDEGFRPATCHGGLYAVPAAIAEAEATGASTDALLRAVVVGYEVATQVARAVPAPRPLRLHPHATLSPIGAAAAVTWLRTSSPSAVLAAADVAASMSMVGPFRHATDGLQARNAWAAGGAVLGFLAADAAASGLGADATTLLDVLRDAYGQVPDEAFLADPAQEWAVLEGYHKRYAACQYTHAALECALALGADGITGDALARVEAITVATHPLALALDDTAPRTALGGKFSVPHVVATTLAAGRADADVYAAPGLTDPTVARLRERVVLAPYGDLPPAPHDRPARVTVRLDDGSEHTREVLSAVGGPDRPLGPDEVLAKAADLTRASAPGFASVAARLVDGGRGQEPWADVLTALLDDGSNR